MAKEGFNKSDRESKVSIEDNERIKWRDYITAFAIFQAVVVIIFLPIVMKVKSPKFRVGTLEIKSLDTNGDAPSFNMSLVGQITIENNNFGSYEFDKTTVDFTYGGGVIDQVVVPKSIVHFKSTKKIDVGVSLNWNTSSAGSNSGLGIELRNGVITLGSKGKMKGRATMMILFNKKKSTVMNCTMTIKVESKAVQSVECK